jgi:hypothetical protein
MPAAEKQPEGEQRSVLTITRERLQDTLDDAVRRGRMTRDDASDLLSEILRRAVAAPGGMVRLVTGAGDGFPIEDYDELTAAQIVTQLGDLEASELRKVRDYERRNANRKTVLAAVEQKLS